jgi:hypothetical protein
MESIRMSQVVELADPKLKAITKRALKTLQLAAEKAIAHHAYPVRFPLTEEASSAERLFLSRFKQLTPAKQQAAAIRVMERVTAPEAQREDLYGDLARVNLQAATPVAVQAKALGLPEALKFPVSHLANLTDIDKIVVPHPVLVVPAQNGARSPQQPSQQVTSQSVTDKLEFRIHKVRCIDDTGQLEIGADEILLGGIKVDESGETGKIAEFTVRNDFKDGVQQTYAPPRRFTSFDLTEGTSFPKSYFVTPVLAERDSGGFATFLDQLYDAVDTMVLSLIATAVGGAIGSTIPGLGTIVGAAVGFAVGKLIGWIIGMFNDDVFPVHPAIAVTISSLNARWSGGLTDSPEGIITYEGHGGTYQLTYDWRVFA